MDNQKKDPGNQNPYNGFNIFNLIILGFILTVFINSILGTMSQNKKVLIEYSQFLDLVENGSVERVQLQEDQILIRLKEDAHTESTNEILNVENEQVELNNVQKEWAELINANKVYYTAAVDDPNMVTMLRENGVKFTGTSEYRNPMLSFLTSWVLPIIFFYFVFSLFTKNLSKKMMGDGVGGGFMSMGKSKAKVYDMEKETGVTFKDVAGQEEAKESVTEIIDFLNDPDKYTAIGAKQPKGALLVGPPGTGKTLLAKAVAGEAKVPFFSLSGSEFVEMFVGVGASRVRDLFSQANKSAPCIIFIDEIDAIGKSRDNQMGGNDEREQTLNQLLAEMDGFDSSKGIVILAATNRPEILDKALLRPGRFDRRIIVEKPDLIGREAILKVHAKKVKLGDDVDLDKIALATSGAAGADLANMVNEAALRAVRMGRKEVWQEDLMEAVEVVIAGKEKKDRILSVKEKEMVAYHEIGHALASALQKNGQPVQKITIVPRTMGTLGYTMNMPEEEKYLLTKEELLAQITILLAGRAAEEVIFNTATTGASNDIERATKMARSMVSQYGMSETFDMMGLESIQNKYLDGRSVATCSEATGEKLDQEVLGIIEQCHEKARKMLVDNKEALIALSKHLIEKENISGEVFMEILKQYNPQMESPKQESE